MTCSNYAETGINVFDNGAIIWCELKSFLWRYIFHTPLTGRTIVPLEPWNGPVYKCLRISIYGFGLQWHNVPCHGSTCRFVVGNKHFLIWKSNQNKHRCMSPLKVYSIDSNSPKCRIKWSCDGSSDENKSMYHGGALLHIILCPDSTVIATLSHFSALFLDVTQVRLAVAETLLMMLPCLLATF